MTWTQFIADFRKGLIPCLVTILGVALIPFIIKFCYLKYFFIAIVLYTLSWIIDGLDGWLARKFNAQSRVGAFLDPLADKIFTISFIVYFWNSLLPIVSITVISIAVALTGIRIFKVKESKSMDLESSLMAIKPGKYKTNIEKSSFAIQLLALLIFGEVYTVFLIISNIVLLTSLPFAMLSLINQISPKTIAKLSEIYNRRFRQKAY